MNIRFSIFYLCFASKFNSKPLYFLILHKDKKRKKACRALIYKQKIWSYQNTLFTKLFISNFKLFMNKHLFRYIFLPKNSYIYSEKSLKIILNYLVTYKLSRIRIFYTWKGYASCKSGVLWIRNTFVFKLKSLIP